MEKEKINKGKTGSEALFSGGRVPTEGNWGRGRSINGGKSESQHVSCTS